MRNTCWLLLIILSPMAQAESCIENFEGGKVCGAGDFTIEKHAINNPPASCILGELLPPITLRVEMTSTATQRYDIGFFSGDYGEEPIGGTSCTVEGLQPLETNGDFDPLSGSGPYRDFDGNGCGDVNKTDGPIFKDFVLDKVLCLDDDGDGELDIKYAVTWQQSGQASCDPFSAIDLAPPTASKCLAVEGNIEEITVQPRPPESSIEIQKDASPSVVTAPGELVEFTVNINNTGTEIVTITSLEDSAFGSLRSAGICSVPQVIEPGDTYACYFNGFVSGNAGDIHQNTITATGQDSSGFEVSDSDDAIVTIVASNSGFIGDAVFHDINANGVRETDEPGIAGVTVELYNAADISVPIDTDVTDFSGAYGFDIDSPGDFIVSIPRGQDSLNDYVLTTNNIPMDIPIIEPDESIYYADFGFAIAQIDLVKHVDKPVVSAPSDTVTYTYTMLNAGPVPLHPRFLSDSELGDLELLGCVLPLTLEPLQLYSCSVSQAISGQPGDIIENTALLTATDHEGYFHSAYASASVEIEDTANAAIGHTVWHDQNGNGAYDTGEGGFNFVSLALSGNEARDTATLLGGLYAFTGLLAGDYQVAVTDSFSILDGYARTNGTGPYATTLQAGQLDLLANFAYALASISANKVANPAVMYEPGGSATFTLTVVNDGETAVELVSLEDTEFGVLDNGNSTCELPQTLGIGESYSCEFTADVTGAGGTVHSNSIIATALDPGGNETTASDNEVIQILAPAAGYGDIGYLVWNDANGNGVVDNGEQGIGGVTLDVLDGAAVIDSGATASNGRYNFRVPNGTYDIEVTDTAGLLAGKVLVSGDQPHTGIVINNTFYVAANFGYALPEPPAIAVTKTGSTDHVIAAEDVAFFIEVENLSATEVVLTSLSDTVFGNLDGVGDCAVGGTIPVGGSYECVFVKTISGTGQDIHVNTVIATVTDTYNQAVSNADDWTITFGAASMAVTKTANPVLLYEPGGSVTFTIAIENDGEVPFEITAIEDTVFGVLDDGNSDCSLPQSLAPAAGYSCTFTGDITGSAGTVHSNTVTVTAEDAGFNVITASDNAIVNIYAPAGGYGDIGYLVWNDADRDGAPGAGEAGIGGVTIDLLSGGEVLQTTTTAADGRYNFRAPNGTYEVDVTDAAGVLGDMELVGGSDPHTGIVIDNNFYIAANFGYALPLVPPSINVLKAGSTDIIVGEGEVSFYISVENSSEDAVELTHLYDTAFGNLDGAGSCAVGITIAAGGVYNCEFAALLSGESGDTHTNVVVAAVQDGFSQRAVGSDRWDIRFYSVAVPVPVLGPGAYVLMLLLAAMGLYFARVSRARTLIG